MNWTVPCYMEDWMPLGRYGLQSYRLMQFYLKEITHPHTVLWYRYTSFTSSEKKFAGDKRADNSVFWLRIWVIKPARTWQTNHSKTQRKARFSLGTCPRRSPPVTEEKRAQTNTGQHVETHLVGEEEGDDSGETVNIDTSLSNMLPSWCGVHRHHKIRYAVGSHQDARAHRERRNNGSHVTLRFVALVRTDKPTLAAHPWYL